MFINLIETYSRLIRFWRLNMKFKEHPEWVTEYPAIDGIAKKALSFFPAQRAIRSDVEEILAKNEFEFNEWYQPRRNAVGRLLEDYKLIGSIPNLEFSDENKKFDVADDPAIEAILYSLEKGLKYLKVINQVWNECRDK